MAAGAEVIDRDRLNPVDPVEQDFEVCYGPQYWARSPPS